MEKEIVINNQIEELERLAIFVRKSLVSTPN